MYRAGRGSSRCVIKKENDGRVTDEQSARKTIKAGGPVPGTSRLCDSAPPLRGTLSKGGVGIQTPKLGHGAISA